MNNAVSLIKEKIDALHKDFVLIALDGRCASGKTTLAKLLSEEMDATVVHMDDFFLQLHQRSEERRNTPGENVDHERFLKEVLIPMSKREEFYYQPFDCKTLSLKQAQLYKPKKICIVEGSYSCHKNLWDYYDLHIFMDVDKTIQKERIVLRNKEKAKQFEELWIPLEEAYINAYTLKEKCELYIKIEQTLE